MSLLNGKNFIAKYICQSYFKNKVNFKPYKVRRLFYKCNFINIDVNLFILIAV